MLHWYEMDRLLIMNGKGVHKLLWMLSRRRTVVAGLVYRYGFECHYPLMVFEKWEGTYEKSDSTSYGESCFVSCSHR